MCIPCVNFCNWFCNCLCDDVEEDLRVESLPTERGSAILMTVRPKEDQAPPTARSQKNLSPIPEVAKALENSNSSFNQLSEGGSCLAARSFNVISARQEAEISAAPQMSEEKSPDLNSSSD